jgi:hypothetical protein
MDAFSGHLDPQLAAGGARVNAEAMM